MTTVAQPRLRLSQTFAALKYPNYRLWFIGQIISLFGTWMQNTAQGYLVYELTRSPAFLGYVGFAAGLPSWIFMLYAGVIADRLSRRNLMVITQTAMMLLAFILGGLAFLGWVQPWHILVLAFCLGIANAFDAPARLALIPDLVEREDLTNAIALNGTMFNSATILGPAAGGVIYALFGPGWCFTINGLSFLAVIAALLMMKLGPQPKPARQAPAMADLKEGVRFVLKNQTIRTLILVVGMTTLFGFSFVNLMPAWAVDILGGDARTNGLLRSFQGIGALVGALSIASLGRFNFRGKLLSLGTFAFPILLFGFSFVRTVPLSLMAITFVGGTVIFIMNLANSLFQDNLPNELRGRASSVYSLTFFGAMPLGAFLIGEIAERTSEPLAIQLGALTMLVGSVLVFLLAPRVRKLE